MKALLSRFRPLRAIAADDGAIRRPVTLDERIEYMLTTSMPFDPDHFLIPAIRNAVGAIKR